MKHAIGGAALVIVAATLSIAFQAPPLSLYPGLGYKADDEQALAYRDSVYTNVSWITSETMGFAQLRFFDAVQGGVALYPRWDQYAAIDGAQEHLAHVLMPANYPVQTPPPDATWPAGQAKPNPGTVVQSRYICLYPTTVLLNRTVMDRIGDDPRQADPEILIVGLGSGAGVSMLTHHFPKASITVVDIDPVVIDMVRDHYPFLRWLEDQRVPDDTDAQTAGRPRLIQARADARLFVRHHGHPQRIPQYDVIILDPYTAGSTIPPHLMTREFYEEIAAILAPGGIVMSNIIGSYQGRKHQVLGGAIYAKRAAGLPYIHNMPVPWQFQGQRHLRRDEEHHERNNLVIASADPVDPERNPGWEQFISRRYTLYPELPAGRHIHHQAYLAAIDDDGGATPVTCRVLLGTSHDGVDQTRIDAALLNELTRHRAADGRGPDNSPTWIHERQRSGIVDDVRQAVLEQYTAEQQPPPAGWDQSDSANAVLYIAFDGVTFARSVFNTVVGIAATRGVRDSFQHQGVMLVGPTTAEREAIAAAGDLPTAELQTLLREKGIDLPQAAIEQVRSKTEDWMIPRVPQFTDMRPNADVLNN